MVFEAESIAVGGAIGGPLAAVVYYVIMPALREIRVDLKAIRGDITNLKIVDASVVTALEHDYPSLRGKAALLREEGS